MHGSKRSDAKNIMPWLPCTSCGIPIEIKTDFYSEYFSGRKIKCANNHQNDWWHLAHTSILDDFLNNTYSLIGAGTMYFSLMLRPGKPTQYCLTDYGIPADAKVLFVNYTPTGMGGLFPVEMHSNTVTMRPPRISVSLWPMPIEPDPNKLGDTPVNILVSWVPHSELDDAWRNIVLAFEAFLANDFNSAIVPANVAVESLLSIALNSYLPKHVGKERAAEFLKQAATYSHQLNVVVPLIVGFLNHPKLPNNIRGALNSLRDLRNDIAHTGTTRKPLDRARCAELLCAALFGFHYMRLLQQALQSK